MFLAIAKLLINAGQKGIFTNANFRVGIEELLEQSVWPKRASKPTHKRLVTFAIQMNNQTGLRSGTCVWVGLYTIVIHPKLCELGHELD
jgi:hypothetical protein